MRIVSFLLTPITVLLNAAATSFSSCNSTWPAGTYLSTDTAPVSRRRDRLHTLPQAA